MHASVWPAITPRPRTVSERSGAFTIPAELPVSVAAEIGDAGAWIARVGAAFERILDGRTRLAPVPGSGSGAAASPTLRVTLDPAQRDAYRLRVAPDGIDLTAADRDGASQGLATLCQAILLSDDDRLPAAELADSPATEWRGFMLDVARHFFPMESLDRVVDYLWLMRLNRFQIHLTDDQGWRVPVPDYPRLVEIGAWRPAGTSDNQVIGGADSSDELRRLDGECRLLGITAVPEVDLPGHASALLSAYPELSCAGGEWAVETRWGIFPAVICASSRSVQTMLERVYGAVADLFAGPYIHVGGDEVPPEPWHACEQCSTLDDPYQTIVRRMTESVLALGRRPDRLGRGVRSLPSGTDDHRQLARPRGRRQRAQTRLRPRSGAGGQGGVPRSQTPRFRPGTGTHRRLHRGGQHAVRAGHLRCGPRPRQRRRRDDPRGTGEPVDRGHPSPPTGRVHGVSPPRSGCRWSLDRPSRRRR